MSSPAHDVVPQLATLVRAPPRGAGWIFEIKYDGYRALATKEGARVQLVSRKGLVFGGLEAVRSAVAALRCKSAVLDGELCALDAEGRPRFHLLQRALGARGSEIVYFVFDVLFLDGVDLRELPLTERKARLAALVRSTDRGVVRRVAASEREGRSFLEAVRSLGLEGLVAKRAARPYRGGRSLDWQKVKVEARQEMVVVGSTLPSGTRHGLGALLLGYYDADGVLRYAGKVGTGFDEATLDTLSRRLESMRVPTPPVSPAPRMRDARWVRPELVVEVRYGEWTADERLRHPVFLGVREDKRARDVVRERPAA